MNNIISNVYAYMSLFALNLNSFEIIMCTYIRYLNTLERTCSAICWRTRWKCSYSRVKWPTVQIRNIAMYNILVWLFQSSFAFKNSSWSGKYIYFQKISVISVFYKFSLTSKVKVRWTVYQLFVVRNLKVTIIFIIIIREQFKKRLGILIISNLINFILSCI